jgi:hypothetical protein
MKTYGPNKNSMHPSVIFNRAFSTPTDGKSIRRDFCGIRKILRPPHNYLTCGICTHHRFFKNNGLDWLHSYDYDALSDDDKINYNIIQNQLQSAIWYRLTLSKSNTGIRLVQSRRECYYLLTQNYAPLNERLETFQSTYKIQQHTIQSYKKYRSSNKRVYRAAIKPNEGSLDVFGNSLSIPFKVSSLTSQKKIR